MKTKIGKKFYLVITKNFIKYLKENMKGTAITIKVKQIASDQVSTNYEKDDIAC